MWDLGIVAVGLSFFIARMIGLSTDNRFVTDTAFDIIALEALLLVPRSVLIRACLTYRIR